MSGNDERKLDGAMNCPHCGFKKEQRGVVDQENAYYTLRNLAKQTVGFLNAKMGLTDYGGNFNGIINFESDYEGVAHEELLTLVDYVVCPICSKRFTEGSQVFEYCLAAIRQREYDFSP